VKFLRQVIRNRKSFRNIATTAAPWQVYHHGSVVDRLTLTFLYPLVSFFVFSAGTFNVGDIITRHRDFSRTAR
jgi:hypothetical protein